MSLTFDLDALKDDAGDMYDVLGQILDKFDDGLITDQVVTASDGTRVWLLDELARDLVEKHADKKVRS